jgi:Ca2+-binding EF-hand superfamily protein
MFKKIKLGLLILAISTFFGGTAFVIAQKATPDSKKQNNVALGEDEVKQLLALMDTDKNGKISKQEFMKFMDAEFDRLDKDKSGELDAKELTQSQVRASRPAVGK